MFVPDRLLEAQSCHQVAHVPAGAAVAVVPAPLPGDAAVAAPALPAPADAAKVRAAAVGVLVAGGLAGHAGRFLLVVVGVVVRRIRQTEARGSPRRSRGAERSVEGDAHNHGVNSGGSAVQARANLDDERPSGPEVHKREAVANVKAGSAGGQRGRALGNGHLILHRLGLRVEALGSIVHEKVLVGDVDDDGLVGAGALVIDEGCK